MKTTTSSCAAYGTWASPITADLIVADSIRVMFARGEKDAVYWVERRPQEAGRSVLVRAGVGDVTPPGFNLRTRVHEYGGGSLLIADGVVYFSNFSDQRLYRQRPNEAPVALTAEGPRRYADACIDRSRGRLVCVCEDHGVGDVEPKASIIAVDLESGAVETLVEGADFYASPRVDPTGTQLAWVQWSHPHMPWDRAQLFCATLDAEGTLVETVAAPLPEVSAPQQLRWSANGVLYFINDPDGWWNLYRWCDGAVEAVLEVEAEIAGPPWTLGESSYDFTEDGALVCAWSEGGRARLGRVELDTLSRFEVELPAHFSGLSEVSAQGTSVICRASSTTTSAAVVQIALDGGGVVREFCRESACEIDPAMIAVAEAITFESDGGEAHAYFYAPKNNQFSAPEGTRPPLLVRSHGGPTSEFASAFNLGVQYWTSRGVAVLDVNYGGSSGYGRAYRERLMGQWGIVDVQDCIAGARALITRGLVDPEKTAINGGSAGGYTTLAVLTSDQDVFKAGASYYGVSELLALARDTHKFESRYLDNLIAPLPEGEAVYNERSPLRRVDGLSCPIIFFQGDEDRVVPPNQAQMMVDALREKKLPVTYLLFEGEQHGFRKAENIKRAFEAEFLFYARIFGYTPAESLPAIEIENL